MEGEPGKRKPETGNRKTENGKTEKRKNGNRKPENGKRKTETGNRKPETGGSWSGDRHVKVPRGVQDFPRKSSLTCRKLVNGNG
jgi:hypothetical protein